MVFSALRAENAVQVPYIHDPTDPEWQHGGLGGVPPTLREKHIMLGKRDPGTPGGTTGVWGRSPHLEKKLNNSDAWPTLSTASSAAAARPKAAMGSHACVIRFHGVSNTPHKNFTPPLN